MRNRNLVAWAVLLAPLMAACSSDENRTLGVSNDGLEQPRASTSGPTGDEVATGQGRSRIALDALEQRDVRSPLIQVYQPAASESSEKIFLSYSAVFADGNALSLMLPYEGGRSTIDAASMRFGGVDGFMWSSGGTDMYSTGGSFRIEPSDEGLIISISDLVVAKPLDAKRSTVLGNGMIAGQLERRCLLAQPSANGLSTNGEPAVEYVPDPNWASEFCARYK